MLARFIHTQPQRHFIKIYSNKYRGVYFSSNPTWKRQVEHVSSSASRMLNILKRNFSDAPLQVKEVVYFTNVTSIAEYACAIWDPQFHY